MLRAVAQGEPLVVALLVDQRADPNFLSDQDFVMLVFPFRPPPASQALRTAVKQACSSLKPKAYETIVRYLISKGVTWGDAAEVALQGQKFDIVRAFLEHEGTDVKKLRCCQATLLASCAAYNQTGLLDLAISKGAEINALGAFG